MAIKDDLAKYPCFLYQMGTIRPIPEDTFLKKYGIEKHKLLFNRKKWREGIYD